MPRRVLRAGLRLYGSLTGLSGGSFRGVGNMAGDEAWLLSCARACASPRVPATARRQGAVPQPDLQRLVPRRPDRLDVPARAATATRSRTCRAATQIYTSLEDDIRAAMQAAIARQHGKKVAAQVGHKFSAHAGAGSARATRTAAASKSIASSRHAPGARTTTASAARRRHDGQRRAASRCRCSCSVASRSRSIAAGGVGVASAAARRRRLAAERHEPPQPRALGRQVEAERQQQRAGRRRRARSRPAASRSS